MIICRAEALDNHLNAIQRDLEIKSQIEERKIRNDAAYEEAKRKEKARQEEKLRQERARAEAEVFFYFAFFISLWFCWLICVNNGPIMLLHYITISIFDALRLCHSF